MAVFNKREVGYIKAIAGVGTHKTFHHSRIAGNIGAADSTGGVATGTANSRIDSTTKALNCFGWCLNRAPITVDASDTSSDYRSWNLSTVKSTAGLVNNAGMPQLGALEVESIPEGDEDKLLADGVTAGFAPTTQRVGEDFYLKATTMKMRFTMPDFGSISGTVQPHHEYRLIIFRNRKPVMTSIDDEGQAMNVASYLNFQYDLFNGYVGRPIGLRGWRGREEFDQNEYYHGLLRSGTTWTTTGATDLNPPGEPALLSPDDVMTLPLNDADYIIHTDERFFLGREHGKSHYEKMVKFEWNQRGSTPHEELHQGLSENFNGNWICLLLSTTNDGVDPDLNYVITQTTSLESA